MYFISYFTFLDQGKLNTIGKSIFSINLYNTFSNGKEVSIIQSFFRSIITLMDLCFLGLLSIMKIKDKITYTLINTEK